MEGKVNDAPNLPGGRRVAVGPSLQGRPYTEKGRTFNWKPKLQTPDGGARLGRRDILTFTFLGGRENCRNREGAFF